MASMSELRAYKASVHALSERLTVLRKLEAEALKAWQDSRGSGASGGLFDKWTDAINRANDTDSAISYTNSVINELEGK